MGVMNVFEPFKPEFVSNGQHQFLPIEKPEETAKIIVEFLGK